MDIQIRFNMTSKTDLMVCKFEDTKVNQYFKTVDFLKKDMLLSKFIYILFV